MSEIIVVEVISEASIIEETVARDGIGLPAGGGTAQFLKKKSAANYDYEWGNAITSGTAPPTGGVNGDIYLQYV